MNIMTSECNEMLQTVTKNVQLLFELKNLLSLMSKPIVIGDVSTAIYYDEPLRQSLRDIDLFVMEYHEEEIQSYTTFTLPEDNGDCIHFIKNGVTVHIHKELRLFEDEKKNELLNNWMKDEEPITGRIGDYGVPVPQHWLNGIIQLSLIKRAIERGSISRKGMNDWREFVKIYLSDEKWMEFKEKAKKLGLEETAKSITRFAKVNVNWCQDVDELSGVKIIEETKGIKTLPVKKSFQRVIYERVKESPTRVVFYWLHDFCFVIAHMLRGRWKYRRMIGET